MTDNEIKAKLEETPIRLPGPWLDEPMTPEESDHITVFSEKLHEIKSRGPFEKFTEDGNMTREYAAAVAELSPYLNAVSHLLYLMAKGEIFKRNLSQNVVINPIAGVWSFLDSVFDFGKEAGQLDGQESLFPDAEKKPPTDGLLLQQFLPMLNGNPTNAVAGISAKRFTIDSFTGVATYKKGGQTIQVNAFSKVSAHLGTPAKKLLDTSVLYLTDANFYRGNTVNPSVVIDLMDYWRRQGYPVDPADDTPEEQARVENLIKWLKKELRGHCKAIQAIKWDGYTGTGKNKTQFASFSFVSSWVMLRGNRLKLNFDIDLATYLVHAHLMQFPVVLLALDNRKPTSYAIGRKIAYHHSMDNNAAIGTNNTLSVISLLEAAPDIPSYQSIVAAKRRDWKDKIKKPLEAALDDNKSVGYLEKWEYRDPRAKTVKTYTAETAAALPWDKYSSLMVDFVVREEPDQTDRRARRAEEKAAAEAKPKKKRGRPKKSEKEGSVTGTKG